MKAPATFAASWTPPARAPALGSRFASAYGLAYATPERGDRYVAARTINQLS